MAQPRLPPAGQQPTVATSHDQFDSIARRTLMQDGLEHDDKSTSTGATLGRALGVTAVIAVVVVVVVLHLTGVIGASSH
jgi:hypothetical protein